MSTDPGRVDSLNVDPLNVEAVNVEAVNVEAVNVEAVNVEAVNVEAVNVDAVNVEAVNVEAVNVEAVNAGDEEYRGPATLRLDDGPVPVEIRMSARFEPIEGRFRWAGRTRPHDMLRERVGAGLRQATIVVPGSPETAVKLGDPDPWGGVRISGTGTPPWFGTVRHGE